jgi:hypothetical protein
MRIGVTYAHHIEEIGRHMESQKLPGVVFLTGLSASSKDEDNISSQLKV